jgi:hypothetical protein
MPGPTNDLTSFGYRRIGTDDTAQATMLARRDRLPRLGLLPAVDDLPFYTRTR